MSVLQLQEESWDSMALLTMEGEVLAPPPCPRKCLCCLCWTCFSSLPVSVRFWGGQQWSEGARGGCREHSCRAEGLVQGCPSSPQHVQSLLSGQSSGLSTELVAYVESVNCTAISLVYMNQ